MFERCPGCSVAREIDREEVERAEAAREEGEREKAESDAWALRACANCGYSGRSGSTSAFEPRESIPSFAGARAKLKTATQDLFRLSGGHSIPVDAPPVAEPVLVSLKPAESTPSSGRKAEASIMFSLEELMKANSTVSVKRDEAPAQLWSMEAATPLFGTAHDQALLTTPMKKEPSSSLDTMTVPSHPPLARRWLPLGLAIGGSCLAVAAAGWWFTGKSQAEAASTDAIAAIAPEGQAPAPAAPIPAPAAMEAAPEQLAAAPGVTEPPPVPVEAAVAEPSQAPTSAPSKSASQGKPAAKKPSAKATPAAVFPIASAFDKGAAKAALNAAAAQSAGCRQGGSAGKGKIVVTFAPSGKVASASLVEGPFSGTAAGNCALRNFKAARVPTFIGQPVTVSKSFSVQ